MDTSIIISAISTIIACCSLGVAYRAFLHSIASRNADKFLELRFQVAELMSLAQKFKDNSQFLSKTQPTKHDPSASEKLLHFIDLIEELHKKLQRDPSSLSENDINDMRISILNIRNKLEFEDERIKKINST